MYAIGDSLGRPGIDRNDSSVTGTSTSLFKHEQDVIDRIRNQIQSEHIGKLASNVYIYDRATGSYLECDIVLVAHSGIYVVELKHWSGHIEVAPYQWKLSHTNEVISPHRNNHRKCQVLKSIYEHEFRTYPTDLWVESVVVLTNPDSVVVGASDPNKLDDVSKHNPTFDSPSQFMRYLRQKRDLPGGSTLDAVQVNTVVDYLVSLQKPKRRVDYTIPGYETVGYLYQTPECIELVARPVNSRTRGLNRFRVFRPPVEATQEEKERFVKIATNTLNAVSDIGEHPSIHKVWRIPSGYGNIIEMSDWSETGTLRDLIYERDGKFGKDEALTICRQIALALHEAHRRNVIHRAVKPENILIMHDVAKLTNFDLSYQVEDHRLTVIPDVSAIRDDGYIAPEVLKGMDIDEGSDYFSLGVIAYQLLTGVKPFTSTREFVAKGGVLDSDEIEMLVEKDTPEATIDAIQRIVIADRRSRMKNGDAIISAFSRDEIEREQGARTTDHNAILQPGAKHDVYTISDFVGAGKDAQVYRAETLESRIVALKMFNREVPKSRIMNEYKVGTAIHCPYVAEYYGIGHWNNDRYFIAQEYVAGKSLREMIDQEQRPDKAMFRAISVCLMEAIEAFHLHEHEGKARPLLHSDIKPENIMLPEKNEAVLIDLGIAGEPRVGVFAGTAGYVPPDSMRGTDMQFSESVDLFALGVTLWEWLFGAKPYQSATIGDTPDMPEYISEEMRQYLLWLQRAVATEGHERFSTIQEMYDAFLECDMESHGITDKVDAERHEEAIHPDDEISSKAVCGTNGKERETEAPELATRNPFVEYLNSLCNSSAANENATAESQIGNEFFERIHVRNPITNYVYDVLFEDKVNVILTGHAGDGKTTIAAEVIQKATGARPMILRQREEIPEVGLVVIKDMSELAGHAQVDTLKAAIDDDSTRYLIISNTGTLINSFRGLRNRGIRVSESELLTALESDRPEYVLDRQFQIINIAKNDSIDTACMVFGRMLEEDNWRECRQCKYAEVCPVSSNVVLIQDSLDTVKARVALMYRRLYEYDIGLTMRQMTGHLAYAITAGLNCEDVHDMSYIGAKSCFPGTMFFNRFFGDDGDKVAPESQQLLPVQRIREADFGTSLDPEFETAAWLGNPTPFPLKGKAEEVFERLFAAPNLKDYCRRRQVRRLGYFVSPINEQSAGRYVCNFLQSPTLMDFLRYSQGGSYISALDERHYRHQILQVLQEHFIGIRLPERNQATRDLYITLNHGENSSRTQMVLATLREDDFKLVLRERYILGDNARSVLCLNYKDGEATMALDLPFLDYVERRYRGEIAEELSAGYVNRLDRFKAEVLAAYGNHPEPIRDSEQHLVLLRIDQACRFRVITILQSDDYLEVM